MEPNKAKQINQSYIIEIPSNIKIIKSMKLVAANRKLLIYFILTKKQIFL